MSKTSTRADGTAGQTVVADIAVHVMCLHAKRACEVISGMVYDTGVPSLLRGTPIVSLWPAVLVLREPAVQVALLNQLDGADRHERPDWSNAP